MEFSHAALPLLAVTVTALIIAEFRGANRAIYVFKPASTSLIIAMAAVGAWTNGAPDLYGLLVIGGLVLSLGGDAALMPPDTPGRFRLGLALFLAAHLAYIVAFWPLSGWAPADILLTVGVAVIAGAFFLVLNPKLGAMRGPVIGYILIISLMLNRAVSTLFSGTADPVRAGRIAVGAALFFVSDVILAANRFWRPWRFHRLSLAFYFAGQASIALSVAA